MYAKEIGSRSEVGHGTAHKTSGGLTQSDLVLGSDGTWKSKKKAGSVPPQLAAYSEAREKVLKKHKVKQGDSFDDHVIKKGTKMYTEFIKTAKKLQK